VFILGKVDFIEIDTLANYIGKGGRIIVWEFDSQIGYDYLPVKLIKSNGDKENIRCSAKLTELIHGNIDIVKYLPYFIVIETTIGRKSISINRVSAENHNISDYILEFHPISETIEMMRRQEDEFLKQKEKEKLEKEEKLKNDQKINKEKNIIANYSSYNYISEEEKAWTKEINKLRWKYSKNYISEDRFYNELEDFVHTAEGSGLVTEEEWKELKRREELKKKATELKKEQEQIKIYQRHKVKEENEKLVGYIFLIIMALVFFIALLGK
jgi:hypothetical protein